MHPQALIFDYGGTLDTNGRHWAHVLWEAYLHTGLPLSEAHFRDAYVYGERALAKAPIVTPDDDFHAVLRKKAVEEFRYLTDNALLHLNPAQSESYAAQVADYCHRYVLRNMEQTHAVLDRLSEVYENIVLVSNFYGNVEAVLSGYRLRHYFRDIVESAVVGVRKPDPAIYRLGVEATGCRPEEVVVVGDSYGKDIQPAKAVGCKAIWLKGEAWKPEATDDSLPDAIITDLGQLPSLLLP